jgi:hypothetical protein
VLLRNDTLEGIRSGRITLVFRRWMRPTVKTGGTLKTRQGVVAIRKVSLAQEARLTAADARKAGFPSREKLLAQLTREGDLYRIEVSWAGEDPRIALRQETEFDAAALLIKLARLPWSRTVLELIESNPGVLALDLATRLGREKLPFKADVRKLKALGLTESLKVGYRLSPRGEAVLRLLRSET